MTAKELVIQVVGRGYKTLSYKQMNWFTDLCERDDSIDVRFGNGKNHYSFAIDAKTYFVDVPTSAICLQGYARISVMNDCVEAAR